MCWRVEIRQPTTISAAPAAIANAVENALEPLGVDEAIEMEAQAQAICMDTKDFTRAFEAFAAKQKPVPPFDGVGGVALSQLTNVGPNLGQGYIVDAFLVVVFGGVGNLWGTLTAALGRLMPLPPISRTWMPSG